MNGRNGCSRRLVKYPAHKTALHLSAKRSIIQEGLSVVKILLVFCSAETVQAIQIVTLKELGASL